MDLLLEAEVEAGAGGSRDRRRKRGRQVGVFKKLYENIYLFITLFFLHFRNISHSVDILN